MDYLLVSTMKDVILADFNTTEIFQALVDAGIDAMVAEEMIDQTGNRVAQALYFGGDFLEAYMHIISDVTFYLVEDYFLPDDAVGYIFEVAVAAGEAFVNGDQYQADLQVAEQQIADQVQAQIASIEDTIALAMKKFEEAQALLEQAQAQLEQLYKMLTASVTSYEFTWVDELEDETSDI